MPSDSGCYWCWPHYGSSPNGELSYHRSPFWLIRFRMGVSHRFLWNLDRPLRSSLMMHECFSDWLLRNMLRKLTGGLFELLKNTSLRCYLVLIVYTWIIPVCKTSEICTESSHIWGPGLEPNAVLPVRYFFIQAATSKGENFTSSPGKQKQYKWEMSSPVIWSQTNNVALLSIYQYRRLSENTQFVPMALPARVI